MWFAPWYLNAAGQPNSWLVSVGDLRYIEMEERQGLREYTFGFEDSLTREEVQRVWWLRRPRSHTVDALRRVLVHREGVTGIRYWHNAVDSEFIALRNIWSVMPVERRRGNDGWNIEEFRPETGRLYRVGIARRNTSLDLRWFLDGLYWTQLQPSCAPYRVSRLTPYIHRMTETPMGEV